MSEVLDQLKTTYFRSGNTKLTCRVLRLCKASDLPVEVVYSDRRVGSNYYSQVEGYRVPEHVYDEIVAQITTEQLETYRKTYARQIREQAEGLVPSFPVRHSNAADVCKQFGVPRKLKKDAVLVPESLADLVSKLLAAESLRDRVQAVKDHLTQVETSREKAVFQARFPAASSETVDNYFRGGFYSNLDDVPLNLLPANEIAELGLIAERNCSVLITDSGATVTPLYRASLSEYEPSHDLADRIIKYELTPPKTLWIANRLVKIAAYSIKYRVYALKDTLLGSWSDHLIEGRFVRNEDRSCYCSGSHEHCGECGGTGIYLRRTLYEHILKFPDDDRTYSFHSYRVPRKLSEQNGADKTRFGYRFNREERLLASKFHFEELLQILSEAAAQANVNHQAV